MGGRMRLHTSPPPTASPSNKGLANKVPRVALRVSLLSAVILFAVGQAPLAVASLGLALFVWLITSVSTYWNGLAVEAAADLISARSRARRERRTAAATTAALQSQASALVTLAGVTLALVLVLPGDGAVTVTLKVAGVSLVLCVLVGLLFANLVAIGVEGPGQLDLATLVYMVTVMSCVFGLLCLASSLAFER